MLDPFPGCGLWFGRHDLHPVVNDSQTPDGTEQLAAELWLHSRLRLVKAGLVSITANYPMDSAQEQEALISPAFVSENLITTDDFHPPHNRGSVLELWKHSEDNNISIVLQLLDIVIAPRKT